MSDSSPLQPATVSVVAASLPLALNNNGDAGGGGAGHASLPLPAGSDKIDFADIKRKSVRGGLVTILCQGGAFVIQLVSTVTLARLLSTDDYGMMAMVLAIIAFAGLFRDLGLSAAAVQKGSLNQAQMSNLFWLNVAMGAGLTGLLAAASPVVGWFYGKPELGPLALLLSTTFLIGSAGTQHGALMQRNMQFGRRAVTNIAGSLVTLVVSIILALQGWGCWALAWGAIVGSATTTAMLFALSSFRPGWWTRGAGMRSMLKFGANITAFECVNYFHRNLDNILIGKFWGPDMLGFYSRAYALLMFPITQIRGPVNAVAFPALSRLRNDPQAFRSYYRNVAGLLAMASMPLVAFLFLTSMPLIEIVLGNRWAGISPIFSILAITAFIQPTAGLRGLVLLSMGNGRRYLNWGILNAVSVCIGFVIGLPWGAIGVAASYAIVNYAILYPSLLMAFKDTPLKPGDFFEPIAAPALASVVAAAGCHLLVFTTGWAARLAVWEVLILSGIIFGVICWTVLWIFPAGRRDLRRSISLIQRAVAGRLKEI